MYCFRKRGKDKGLSIKNKETVSEIISARESHREMVEKAGGGISGLINTLNLVEEDYKFLSKYISDLLNEIQMLENAVIKANIFYKEKVDV